jgi:tRNA-Thr(GGU) m(6)t(6)A37 methyltransferase TsaA
LKSKKDYLEGEANKEIKLRPIGTVITEYSDDIIRNSLRGVLGKIIIFDEYKEGLCCLKDFSHIIAIGYANKSKQGSESTLKVRLRKIERLYNLETPEVGVFASGSPDRPNLLIISILKLMDIKENVLEVDNLDMYNGTPILDIRPFTLERMPIGKIEVPDWYKKIWESHLSK